MKSDKKLRQLTLTGLMAALITLFTAYIVHIPVGAAGGYIHLGDALIYLSAALLPPPYAMAAGAIGGGVIAIVYFAGGNAAAGLAITGAALICAGITVFSFRGALLASKGIILLTQKCVTAIKNKIIRKESR